MTKGVDVIPGNWNWTGKSLALRKGKGHVEGRIRALHGHSSAAACEVKTAAVNLVEPLTLGQ